MSFAICCDNTESHGSLYFLSYVRKNSAVWTEISARYFVNVKSLFLECSVFATQHYGNGNKKNTVPNQNVA